MLQDGYIDKVYYRFHKVEKPIANVFAIHGLGGHCIWFDEGAKYFNKKNINFFSFDLPGFGQSKYPRGVVTSYNDWINVSKEVLEKYLIDFKIDAPVFILGHSMGSLIALMLSKTVKANGWIFSVPGLQGNPDMWPYFDLVLPTICKAVFKPNEPIVMPFGPEAITKNKETQLKMKKDNLRVISPNASLFMHLHFLTKAATKVGDSFDSKFLLLQAGNDLVCSNDAMDKFFENSKSSDKTKKLYPGVYHDLFIENEISLIVDDVSEWISKRT